MKPGSYDKCVSSIREKNKDDMLAVVQTIFSHVAVQQKNTMVIMLIVSNLHNFFHSIDGLTFVFI